MSLEPLAARAPGRRPTREIREALAGNLCRCTGYEGIVAAVPTSPARGASAVTRGAVAAAPYPRFSDAEMRGRRAALEAVMAEHDTAHRSSTGRTGSARPSAG